MQKVVITNDENVVNKWLAQGWKVKGATPLRVACTGRDHTLKEAYHGKISYLLEKSV